MEKPFVNAATQARTSTSPFFALRGRNRIPCRPLCAAFALAACVAVPGALEAQGQAATTKEYKVKASFLFNFAQFVEWPAGAFANAASPVVIGVLGDDDFGPFLDQIVQGEKIRQRRLVVRRSRTVDELKDCHILFISRSEESRLAVILAGLADGSVLTVGEVDGFARRGGAINFLLEGEKLRFEINAAASARHGLKISSQLLSLGRPVATEEGAMRRH